MRGRRGRRHSSWWSLMRSVSYAMGLCTTNCRHTKNVGGGWAVSARHSDCPALLISPQPFHQPNPIKKTMKTVQRSQNVQVMVTYGRDEKIHPEIEI